MKCKLTLLIGAFIFIAYNGISQEKISLNGYVKDLHLFMYSPNTDQWINSNMIHNRMNFRWYPNQHFTLGVELRNRVIYGNMLHRFVGYNSMIESDNGWVTLSKNIIDERNVVWNSSIDRAWMEYNTGSFNIRMGRQRINWGQTLIWNPNDLFNAYSFFDFDYEEKPGSDAIRIQYYTGVSSLVEIAAKVDKEDRITAATRFRFNKWNYDFQAIAGIIDSEDLTLGLGWAGDIKGAGFRGEFSYFHPKNTFSDTSGTVQLALSLDYSFKNSLYILGEGIYNGFSDKIPVDGLGQYYFMPLSVKTLTFSKFSCLLQVSYPITPLFKGSVSTMWYPSVNGFYAGPTLEYSLKNNLDLSVIDQFFTVEFMEGQRDKLNMLYARLRWSF